MNITPQSPYSKKANARNAIGTQMKRKYSKPKFNKDSVRVERVGEFEYDIWYQPPARC